MNMILVALCFNGIDFLSGIIKALKNKDLKSSVLRDGLFKKAGFVLVYALAFIIDTKGFTVGINLGFDILPIICGYAILTEIVSVIENVGAINPDLIPEKVKELFHIDDIENLIK